MSETIELRTGAARAQRAKLLRRVHEAEAGLRENFQHAADLRSAAVIMGKSEFSSSAVMFAERLEAETVQQLMDARAALNQCQPATKPTQNGRDSTTPAA